MSLPLNLYLLLGPFLDSILSICIFYLLFVLSCYLLFYYYSLDTWLFSNESHKWFETGWEQRC